MPEKPDTNEFLVSKIRLGIITEALKTSVGTGIVNPADKQIKLNQLIFHRQENSTNQPVCLSFQLLIRICLYVKNLNFFFDNALRLESIS